MPHFARRFFQSAAVSTNELDLAVDLAEAGVPLSELKSSARKGDGNPLPVPVALLALGAADVQSERQAAALLDAHEPHELGLLANRWFQEADDEHRLAAVALWRAAWARGHAASGFSLASWLWQGAEPEAGVRILRVLAAQEVPWAMYALGTALREGKGAARDAEEAARWLQAAAESGEVPPAANDLANLLADGGDDAAAQDWFLRAAKTGDPVAMFMLGMWAAAGRALPSGAPDPAAALQWLQASADAGHALARFHVGLMHHQGAPPAVPRDLREAARHYGQAAELGVRPALVNLAIMHLNGEISPDVDEAAARRLLEAAMPDELAAKVLASLD